MGVFVALVGYILIKGVPNLSLDLFQLKYTSDNCSMLPAIFNTHLHDASVAGGGGRCRWASSRPFTLTEYARRRQQAGQRWCALTTETLAGHPLPIVYGLFGYLFLPRAAAVGATRSWRAR